MGMRLARGRSAGFLFVIMLLAPAAVFGGPAEEATAVIDRWVTVFNANDADAVAKLYAQDATLLGTLSPILSEGPGPISAYFSPIRGSGITVAMGERRTLALGDGAALATGFYEFTRIQDGNPVPLPAARFTFVVAKRGGDWLIAHHHSSQRPKPPQ